MSRIVELQRELQDASMAIARAERTLAAHPETPSVLATLRTIQKRRENLQEQFSTVANELGLDVCSYRIELADDNRATIAGMTAVLGAFQKTFTSVYDALVNGPKQTSKTSADTLSATAFGFAYTFPGSIGVMMTLPNERLLIEETQLGDAMKKTFELMTARKPIEIQALAEKLGVAAVRQAHQWALENAKAQFGADIIWQRDKKILQEIRVQPQELEELARAMSVASAKEEITVVGELQEVSVHDKTFKMLVDGKIIGGTFDTAISHAHPVELPKTYQATMNSSQRIVVADKQEEITYFLLRLESPPSSVLGLLPDVANT
jgi:hypothetical protein